ncbi:MAG: HAMP domain-containing sensor histidine kinase [Rikenellaceae bacterium]
MEDPVKMAGGYGWSKSGYSYEKEVSKEEIISNNLILSPEWYDNIEIAVLEGFELVNMSDLVYSYNNYAIVNASIEACRHISHLDVMCGAVADFHRSFDKVKRANTEGVYSVLNKDLLVVSDLPMIDDEGGAVLYKHIDGLNIIPSGDVYVFDFKKDIDACYVVNELNKEYVRCQISAIADKYDEDWDHFFFSEESFLNNVSILMPTARERQKALYEVELLKHQEQKILDLGRELDLLKSEKQEELERNIRLRKHALAQVLNRIQPAIDILDRCRKRGGGVMNDSDIAAHRTGESVASYFDRLKTNVDRLSELVKILHEERTYDESQSLNIRVLLEEYAANCISPKFTVDLDCSDIDRLKRGACIDISKADFMQMMDNIVTNADRWGFTDDSRKDYSIRIRPQLTDRRNVTITISNNGNTLPQGMSAEKIFNWGVGSGTGLGTYQTKSIVEHFGGTISFNEDVECSDGYCVEYKIGFPISK